MEIFRVNRKNKDKHALTKTPQHISVNVIIKDHRANKERLVKLYTPKTISPYNPPIITQCAKDVLKK